MIVLNKSDTDVIKDMCPQSIFLLHFNKKVLSGVSDQVSINIHRKVWNQTRGQLYESIKEIIWSH
jgi:hypothetical protein